MKAEAVPPGPFPVRPFPPHAIPTALLLALSCPGKAAAQAFTQMGSNLPGLEYSDVAWGDHDNDGNLDLVMAGYDTSSIATTRIARNANGSFPATTSAGLQGVYAASLSWGDYDNDGNPDLLMAGGYQTYHVVQVHRNNGGTFTNAGTGLPGRSGAMIAWGDYDNDGDLDLALGGDDGAAGPLQIHRNDGNGVFTDTGAVLPAVSHGSLGWGDFDNDGDLDLAVTGLTGTGSLTAILRNDGRDIFTDLAVALPGISQGDLAWGDFDNDGDLDLVLAGESSGQPVTRLIRNDGQGVFMDTLTELPGLRQCSVAWGDCDNDGDLDLAVQGRLADNSTIAQIRRNDGGGDFSSVLFNRAPFGVSKGGLALGDCDNDGDLDLALTGLSGGLRVTQIWRNNEPGVNTSPSSPHNLSAGITGGVVTLSWEAATDDRTPATALTYNVRAGTTPGGSEIVSPHASQASGVRRIADTGNAQLGLTFTLRHPPQGVVYWSVQAVDSSFLGGPFAAESSFTATPPPAATTGAAGETSLSAAMLLGRVHPKGLAANYWFEWGLTTAYGGTSPVQILPAGNTPAGVNTVITGLLPETIYHYRLVAESAAGQDLGSGRTFKTSLFSKVSTVFPGLSSSEVIWGDYNNDGHLDLVLSGRSGSTRYTRPWRNQGFGYFTEELSSGLPPLLPGQFAWGDYDSDGFLDLALTGELGGSSPASVSQIRRNNGIGGFIDINAGLPPAGYFGTAAWGDYDNDGDLDLAVAGSLAAGSAQIRRNDGSGVFTDITAGLPPFYGGALAWADYDNDGDADLALTGDTTGPVITQIRRNDGNGVFTDIGVPVPGTVDGALAWGDYDNDGDPDLIVAGSGDAGNLMQLRRNDGGGVFMDAGASLPALGNPALAWGDYDNDGDLDLAIAGTTAVRSVTQIRRNDGGGVFTDIAAGLTGIIYGELSWGDMDNDGDLDLAVTGSTGILDITEVWRNNTVTPNTAPSAPAGLTASSTGGRTTFSWQPASDTQTPAAALTYNIRVGTTPGGSDIVSPEAHPATGRRRLPAMGNAQHRLTFQMQNVPNRMLYWSVQAVDSSFAGGPFAPEGTFLFTITPEVVTGAADGFTQDRATLRGSINPRGMAASCYFEWGSTTAYGNVTPQTPLAAGNAPVNVNAVITGLAAATAYHFRLVAVTAAGTTRGADAVFSTPLFVNSGISLPVFTGSAMAWGDYDNDNDMDLVITGANSDGTPVAQLRRNEGGGVFSAFAAGVPGVIAGALAWADYDLDGDLDLAIAGLSGTERIAKVLRNEGGEVFVDSGEVFPGVSSASLAWGDYDNDGDPDLVLAGSADNSGRNMITRLFRNDGGYFTPVTTALPGVGSGALAWGDYDGDGDLDLVLAGGTGTAVITQLYRNTGGVFTHIWSFPALDNSSLAWGDYDSDGDLDLAMLGSFNGVASAWIHRNTGGSFTDIAAGLPGMSYTDLAWGDYDHDGDLDLAAGGQIFRNTAGAFASIPNGPAGAASVAWVDYDNDTDLDLCVAGGFHATAFTQLWRNGSPGANAAPSAPFDLYASAPGGNLLLSWQAASDAETPAAALTYNVRVGLTPGGSEIMTAQAHAATGFLRVPGMGNAQHGLNLRLDNLPVSTIHWSVQAVDSGFRGGPFAPEHTYQFTVPPAVVTDAPGGITGASATLSGTANPRGQPGTWHFEWGSTPALGNATPTQTLAAAAAPLHISAAITGLVPANTYYCRAVAVTAAGTARGVIVNFTTAPFTDFPAALPGLIYPALAWGDYDRDGDLDLALSGYTGPGSVTQIRRNDGGGVFTDINAGLPGVSEGALAWGDYDNDGDLDLVFTGTDGAARIARLLRNDGGVFRDTAAGLTGIDEGALAWGDYDHDGDLDLVMSGDSAIGPLTRLRRNDGGGVFTNVAAGLPDLRDSALAWADYDQDGDLDLILCGDSGSGFVTQLRRNDGSGVFTAVATPLPGVFDGALAWGDYDSDGDPDLALAGNTGSGRIAQIRRNDAGVFTDIAAGLPGFEWGTFAWADYDSDGDLDLVFAGFDGTGSVTQLRRNLGGVFTHINSGLPVMERGAFAWGDVDHDGNPDLALAGIVPNGTFITQLKRNGLPSVNLPPSAPSLTAASVSGATTTFSWASATDARTPNAGLTYNLRVGTAPGSGNILSAQSLSANGYRLLPGPGNTQSGLTHRLLHLPGGIYYWGVQAVDSGWLGGPFAENVLAVGSTLTAGQLWRFQYFGTVENTGRAADLADPDGDGLLNLMEFAGAAHPLAFSPPPGSLTKNGSHLEFTYTRAKAALAEVNDTVEAADLTSGPWSAAGITSTVLSEDAVLQTVQAAVPAGASKRFVRLRVTRR